MDAEPHQALPLQPQRRRSRLILVVLAFALVVAMFAASHHIPDFHERSIKSAALRRLEPSAIRSAVNRELKVPREIDRYNSAMGGSTDKKADSNSAKKKEGHKRSGGGK